MAAGELLSELVRAHYEGNRDRFGNVLSQLIAAESRSGHIQVARKLKELRDESRSQDQPRAAVPIARTKRDLSDLLEVSYSSVGLDDLLLNNEAMDVLRLYVSEQRAAELLSSHGLVPRRKLLLHGPPGTGKTLTAQALAGELKLPIARIRIELLFSKLMGETASALADIFAEASRLRAIYLFDEFDALGRERQSVSDIGEIRRVVSTFLQLLDADRSQSIFVAATNIPESIDLALVRRFDDVIEFDRPPAAAIELYIRRNLRGVRFSKSELVKLTELSRGLTLADMSAAINSARKEALLSSDDADLKHLVTKSIATRRRNYVNGVIPS